MKNLRVFTFVVLICIAVPAGAQSPKTNTPPAGPSLDSLANQIDSYWKLLLQRKKHQAAEYVVPSDRDLFSSTNIPPFSDPRLKSLELSADRTEATATVIVKRALPPLTQLMEWPVTEHWRFENGNWFRRFERPALPTQTGFGEARKKQEPEQNESVRSELLGMLHFEKSMLDFGTVRQGASLPLSVKYTLAGDEPLSVTLKNSAPGFTIRGLTGQYLMPGQQRELTIEVPIWNYDGAVNERVVLVAHRKGVEVPFEIAVTGNVYVPVSIVPNLLRFEKDDSEKEVLVRNNSKSDLELRRFHTETGAVSLEPIPATILAGQQLAIKVKSAKESRDKRSQTRDNLSIDFAKPVEGMSGLSLAVVIHPEKEKANNSFNPARGVKIPPMMPAQNG